MSSNVPSLGSSFFIVGCINFLIGSLSPPSLSFVLGPNLDAKAVAEGKIEADKLNAQWENKAVESLSGSWKDEFITIVVLSPCILIFFPSFQPYVRLGFDILGTLPDWYINLIYITVCAGLGLKGVGGISKFMKGKK